MVEFFQDWICTGLILGLLLVRFCVSFSLNFYFLVKLHLLRTLNFMYRIVLSSQINPKNF